MATLHNLIAKVKANDAQAGADLEREFKALSSRRQFGLNFERHQPEAVELPNRPVRRGDKVRILPPRGSTEKADPTLWLVKTFAKKGNSRLAELSQRNKPEETITTRLDDLVVVAEFGDTIYPGLAATGGVTRGGDKPCHTVINGENYHVLKALTWTHRGKIDAIYIDPPYNTGAKDWKYNNDYVEKEDHYRHSKWLAMMERRLLIAKELLKPEDSVLLVTIDEKEYLRLGLLLEQVFPDSKIRMVSTQINPKGVGVNEGFKRVDEYIFIARFGSQGVTPSATNCLGCKPIDSAEKEAETEEDEAVSRIGLDWQTARRRDLASVRKTRPAQFYPIYVNEASGFIESIGDPIPHEQNRDTVEQRAGCVAVFPVRKDGTEMNWSVTGPTFWDRWKKGYARAGRATPREPQKYIIQYLKSGSIADVEEGRATIESYNEDGSVVAYYDEPGAKAPPTQWFLRSHNAEHYGTKVIRALLGGRKFPFPKSLFAVEDLLRLFVAEKSNAVVLDFFSGSGTTAHAVMQLNKQDDGGRQCISVTNNEVGADEQESLRGKGLRPGDPEWEQWGICDYITKPRVEAAITGKTPEGEPIVGEYKFGNRVDIEKPRSFKHVGFTEPQTLDSPKKKKLLVAMIDGLPQTLVTGDCPFIVSDKHKSSVLFDTQHAKAWLTTLEEQEHITDFYIVTPVKKTFDMLKEQVSDLLGPVIVNEEVGTPMSDGFEENSAFFTLTYETPVGVNHQTAFKHIAPLLWLRAGSTGRMINKQPNEGWDMADSYGLLVELDKASEFMKAARKAKALIKIAYIVTDDERRFQTLVRRLPDGVEAIRLYESYLTNFAFANGETV